MTKPQRETIRKAQLGEVMNPVLAALQDELGQRSAALLTRFYMLHVVPLEYRIAWLERPWWKRFGKKPEPPQLVAGSDTEAVKEAAVG